MQQLLPFASYLLPLAAFPSRICRLLFFHFPIDFSWYFSVFRNYIALLGFFLEFCLWPRFHFHASHAQIEFQVIFSVYITRPFK